MDFALLTDIPRSTAISSNLSVCQYRRTKSRLLTSDCSERKRFMDSAMLAASICRSTLEPPSEAIHQFRQYDIKLPAAALSADAFSNVQSQIACDSAEKSRQLVRTLRRDSRPGAGVGIVDALVSVLVIREMFIAILWQYLRKPPPFQRSPTLSAPNTGL